MLTHRGGQGSRVAEVKDAAKKKENDDDCCSSEEEVVQVGHDPLKWFGFLVPTTLRQSQACFTKAVEISVLEVANVQNEIEGVMARQKFLKRTKAKLQKEEEEDKRQLAPN